MCDVDKLLFLIKQRAPIYNLKLKQHNDKRVIDKLWKEVANEMKTTVAECRSKYTSLRNSYARFLRQKPASGLAKQKKKTWYLADSMTFLKDHMMVFKRKGSCVGPTADIKEENSLSTILSSVPDVEHCEGSIDSNATPPCSKKMKITSVEKTAEPISSYYRTELGKTEAEDTTLTFFKSLLPDVQKLSDQRKRKVKQDFLLNLNKLLEEQEMESFKNVNN